MNTISILGNSLDPHFTDRVFPPSSRRNNVAAYHSLLSFRVVPKSGIYSNAAACDITSTVSIRMAFSRTR
jgi:hypothetical protein